MEFITIFLYCVIVVLILFIVYIIAESNLKCEYFNSKEIGYGRYVQLYKRNGSLKLSYISVINKDVIISKSAIIMAYPIVYQNGFPFYADYILNKTYNGFSTGETGQDNTSFILIDLGSDMYITNIIIKHTNEEDAKSLVNSSIAILKSGDSYDNSKLTFKYDITDVSLIRNIPITDIREYNFNPIMRVDFTWPCQDCTNIDGKLFTTNRYKNNDLCFIPNTNIDKSIVDQLLDKTLYNKYLFFKSCDNKTNTLKQHYDVKYSDRISFWLDIDPTTMNLDQDGNFTKWVSKGYKNNTLYYSDVKPILGINNKFKYENNNVVANGTRGYYSDPFIFKDMEEFTISIIVYADESRLYQPGPFTFKSPHLSLLYKQSREMISCENIYKSQFYNTNINIQGPKRHIYNVVVSKNGKKVYIDDMLIQEDPYYDNFSNTPFAFGFIELNNYEVEGSADPYLYYSSIKVYDFAMTNDELNDIIQESLIYTSI